MSPVVDLSIHGVYSMLVVGRIVFNPMPGATLKTEIEKK